MKKLKRTETEEWIDDIAFSIPDGVYAQGSDDCRQPYGDRSDYPAVSDEDWQKVNYNSIMQCAVCDLRNRCGQTFTVHIIVNQQT